MQHIFVSSARRALPRWSAAFPDLQLQTEFSPGDTADASAMYWLELGALRLRGDEPDSVTGIAGSSTVEGTVQFAAASLVLESLVFAGATVVALSAVPLESEAFLCLSRGARGYCHAQATPEQLRDVAQTVATGRLWMPPELLSRITGLAQRMEEPSAKSATADLSPLTEREEEVSVLVGRGFSNREIAETLAVSERTVKANLTAIFEKLGLRDRVQLALYVNRLPIR